jgi:nucleoid DNA-binding protein
MAGIRDIARRAHVKPEAVTAVFEAITSILSEDKEDVRLAGFGTFQANIQEPRVVHSPVLPGGVGTSPRRRSIRFVISRSLRSSWELGT